MTAEQFHDALNLLPMELVEEADRRRQNPKKRDIPWSRYAGLAACLVLLLGCSWLVHGMFHAGGKSAESAVFRESAQEERDTGAIITDEAAPAEVPEMEEAPAAGEPGLSLVAVVEAPTPAESSVNYQSPPQVQVIAQAEEMPVETELPEGWFESRDLIAVFLTGYEEAPQPQKIWQEEDGWHLQFPTPAAGTYAAKSWYVLLEAPKGQISPDQIQIVYS